MSKPIQALDLDPSGPSIVGFSNLPNVLGQSRLVLFHNLSTDTTKSGSGKATLEQKQLVFEVVCPCAMS